MAQRNYWVDGLSGTGKSSVYEELRRRKYPAVSTDRAWKDPETRLWVEMRALAELESGEPEVLFVCGGNPDPERYLSYFARIAYLRIDEATMRERLGRRTEADWSLGQEGVDLTLALHRTDVAPPGALEIDATRPLSQVVDDVLRVAGEPDPGGWWPESDVLSTAVRYLEEQGTAELDPSAFDPEELRRYYEELHGASERGTGYAMTDAIAHLRDSAQRDT